jgi:hypothetical protein
MKNRDDSPAPDGCQRRLALRVSDLQWDLLERLPFGEWVNEFKVGEEVAKKRKDSGASLKVYGPREETWEKLVNLGAVKRRWVNDGFLFGHQEVVRVVKLHEENDQRQATASTKI